MFKKLIGSASFYKNVMMLAIPIMIQNGISFFVNMLDNIMVGSLSTPEMTAVTVCNQLLFVFNLCLFGAVSGAGIFGAQFFGKEDYKGLRYTFRFKILFCLLLTACCIALLLLADDFLIGLYLTGEGSPEDIAATITYAKQYISVMVVGLVPFAITQSYSSTLRETGRARLPMYAGICAVVINLTFNWLLIFGNLGFPALGVRGAAIATVMSRFVEMLIISFVTYKNRFDNKFIIGAFSSFKIPKNLLIDIFKKGLPLMLNETAWAGGMAVLTICYSISGYEVVSAQSINTTFFDVFAVAFIAIGSAIGIVLGQLLGAGKKEEARLSCPKLIFLSFSVTCIISIVFLLCAPHIPKLYNVPSEIKNIASHLLMVSACILPIDAIAHASYFTLRSGGKVLLTILFDSVFVWVLMIPVAFTLVTLTSLDISIIYACVQSLILVKCILGLWLVKKGVWLKNIVEDK